ncbi:hypothetical protein FQZ97_937670 [compost metagenome]
MPVGFRKISPYQHSFLPESLKNIAGYIGPGVISERPGCALVIAVAGVEEVNAVVVFCSENQVFHAGISGCAGPLFRIKFYRVKLLTLPPIPPFILIIPHRTVSFYPVFVADAPAFNDPGHGIDPPVNDHPELLVTPVFQVGRYFRILRVLIRGGNGMHRVLTHN